MGGIHDGGAGPNGSDGSTGGIGVGACAICLSNGTGAGACVGTKLL